MNKFRDGMVGLILSCATLTEPQEIVGDYFNCCREAPKNNLKHGPLQMLKNGLLKCRLVETELLEALGVETLVQQCLPAILGGVALHVRGEELRGGMRL